MTDPTHDERAEYTTIGPDAARYERYAMLELDDRMVLLYDRDEEDAWLQSDATVDLDAIA